MGWLYRKFFTDDNTEQDFLAIDVTVFRSVFFCKFIDSDGLVFRSCVVSAPVLLRFFTTMVVLTATVAKA